MKILSVHNSYQTPGGEDQVFAQETELLRAHGHQVLSVPGQQRSGDRLNPLVLLGNTIWNRQIHQKLRALMRQEKPDIVHVHNTFPVISPAVYYAANEEGIPVVQTLHNYRYALSRGHSFPRWPCVRGVRDQEHTVARRAAWLLSRQQAGDSGRRRDAGDAQL